MFGRIIRRWGAVEPIWNMANAIWTVCVVLPGAALMTWLYSQIAWINTTFGVAGFASVGIVFLILISVMLQLFLGIAKSRAEKLGLALIAFAVIILVAGVVIFAREHNGDVNQQGTNSQQFAAWPDPYAPISVVGKEFQNETVVLDGMSYHNCKFINVKFKYNGTTAIQFFGNEVSGPMILTSDNPAVAGAIFMTRAFDALKSGFKPPAGEITNAPVVHPNEK